MSSEWVFQTHSPSPVCVGTGLIALDILINESEESMSYTAGGSSGNVLTILSYLGWKSYPVAYLGKDDAADLILDDLATWKVDQKFVSLGRTGGTPIIIERLLRDNGHSTHKFEFTCPNCNTRLPRNRPVPYDKVSRLVEEMPASHVFYFDRPSRSALEIATSLKKKGALVFFEPATLRSGPLFRSCLDISHIVKYSFEQIESLGPNLHAPLEIQTLGAEGLRYRHHASRSSSRDWHKIPAFHVSKLVDSAGAGDWCTAGILHLTAQSGARGFERIDAEQLDFAMKFGQALASLNCSYEGARGLMYGLRTREMREHVMRLINGTSAEATTIRRKSASLEKVMEEFCPACKKEVGNRPKAILRKQMEAQDISTN